MSKKFFGIAVLFALIVGVSALPVSAFETDGKYMIVEVSGQGENRLAAIEGGLVEALRIASGSFIDSKTEMNNEELTERIISYSRGSIAKYEVTMADDTRADEGIYTINLKVWVESELLRDGVKVATNKTAKVSFSKSDLQPEKEQLKVSQLESHDSLGSANRSNAESGVEALSAMLERYNPEDFISIKVVGKVAPVKGKEAEDLAQVLVEVSFNDSLYHEAFIPDLKQVLDVISAKKKDITLTKQRDILRRINDMKGAPMADTSVIMYGAGLKENDFQLAVYDKPDRFGCRLYSFKKEDSEKILDNAKGILAKFRGRIARVKGIEIELIDGNGDVISTEEVKVTLPFLLTDSVVRNNLWSFHPTIMNYMGMYLWVPLYIESKTVTIPLRFELPTEFQEITAEINTKIVFEDDFADACGKTRNALHNTAINLLTKGRAVAKSEFQALAETGYPLAEIALDSIEANEIKSTPGLLLEEYIDRLAPLRDKGNYSAIQGTALIYEAVDDYETQKKAVPYLTQAAMVHPEAMIRMGEVYEQGFYDVKPNPKKADFYYKEGTRILSLLAAQGLPFAAVALGHVYIEGLGTKQDIPRAERFYKFAEKSGYIDPEYLVWTRFGFTLRQVTIPEKFRESLKQFRDDSIQSAKTCMYLIREKKFTLQIHVRVRYDSNGYSDLDYSSICNTKPIDLFSLFKVEGDNVILPRNNKHYVVSSIRFNTPIQEGKSYHWREEASFKYKK